MVNNPFEKANKTGDQNNAAPLKGVPTIPKEKDLSDVYEEKAKKKKKITGFHIEDDVKAVIETKSKEFGRGWQSDIANDLLRKYFKSKGWL